MSLTENTSHPRAGLNGVTPPPGIAPDASTPLGTGDALDLAQLRLSQNFAATIGVKKALLHVPVRRPDRQWWIRVHPDPAYREGFLTIERKEDNETDLVLPHLAADVPAEAHPKLLFTAITRTGVVFLWPVRLPGEDGRLDDYNRTAREAAELATTQWVRVAADRAAGAYQIYEATAGNLSAPEWPTESFERLIQIAFKDRIITRLDHPVLRHLGGEL